MSPGEKREEYRSRQKVTYDRITDTGRKADERNMCTDQTHVNLMHVDETPLRTRLSTSRFTVYRTVNLIKEHLSESPGPYADKVDKLTTPTTTKYALNWNVVYLNGCSTMRTIKLIIEDAKINVNTRNCRSISCLVLSCLWLIHVISCLVRYPNA